LTVEFDFYADDGSNVTAVGVGEAMDSSDKASNKAMSAAHKYVLMETFLIPTKDVKDVEKDEHGEVNKKTNVVVNNSHPSAITWETLYDEMNDAHIAFLGKVLKSKNVAEEFWDQIAVNMKGKAMKDVAPLIKAVGEAVK
jgi:hypothetical protein